MALIIADLLVVVLLGGFTPFLFYKTLISAIKAIKKGNNTTDNENVADSVPSIGRNTEIAAALVCVFISYVLLQMNQDSALTVLRRMMLSVVTSVQCMVSTCRQTNTPDENFWQESRTADTPQAYRDYLRGSPPLAHETEARQRLSVLDDAAWSAARSAQTVRGYQDYIDSFPAGAHIVEAKSRRDALNKSEISNKLKGLFELWRARTDYNYTDFVPLISSIDDMDENNFDAETRSAWASLKSAEALVRWADPNYRQTASIEPPIFLHRDKSLSYSDRVSSAMSQKITTVSLGKAALFLYVDVKTPTIKESKNGPYLAQLNGTIKGIWIGGKIAFSEAITGQGFGGHDEAQQKAIEDAALNASSIIRRHVASR